METKMQIRSLQTSPNEIFVSSGKSDEDHAIVSIYFIQFLIITSLALHRHLYYSVFVSCLHAFTGIFCGSKLSKSSFSFMKLSGIYISFNCLCRFVYFLFFRKIKTRLIEASAVLSRAENIESPNYYGNAPTMARGPSLEPPPPSQQQQQPQPQLYEQLPQPRGMLASNMPTQGWY
jgi:hypothetical protein